MKDGEIRVKSTTGFLSRSTVRMELIGSVESYSQRLLIACFRNPQQYDRKNRELENVLT